MIFFFNQNKKYRVYIFKESFRFKFLLQCDFVQNNNIGFFPPVWYYILESSISFLLNVVLEKWSESNIIYKTA